MGPVVLRCGLGPRLCGRAALVSPPAAEETSPSAGGQAPPVCGAVRSAAGDEAGRLSARRAYVAERYLLIVHKLFCVLTLPSPGTSFCSGRSRGRRGYLSLLRGRRERGLNLHRRFPVL